MMTTTGKRNVENLVASHTGDMFVRMKGNSHFSCKWFFSIFNEHKQSTLTSINGRMRWIVFPSTKDRYFVNVIFESRNIYRVNEGIELK